MKSWTSELEPLRRLCTRVFTTVCDAGYYSTEIPEININLLPNTCNFHRSFWLIFSLHLSENAQNVYFREANLQDFPGEHAPDPP